MRKLAKGDAPDVLVKNSDRWHAELAAILARGEKPTESVKGRYRHAEIKNALIAETHGKCAYCESKLRHVAHGDIEHIAPKSRVPSKAYDWNNLTLACDVCNENKGDYYSDDPVRSQDGLVDPYVDDPADHFLFMREVVVPRPDSLRAKATEAVIKLSRAELLERRRERMAFLDGLVQAYCLAGDQFKPMLLNDIFENHLTEADEYYATSSAYIHELQTKGVIAPERVQLVAYLKD